MVEINLTNLGIILIFIGFILLIFGYDKTNTKISIGGFIGFLPFGFSNEPQLLKFIILLNIIMVLIFIFFMKT